MAEEQSIEERYALMRKITPELIAYRRNVLADRDRRIPRELLLWLIDENTNKYG